MNTGLQVSASLLSVIWDLDIGMEVLGHLVILGVSSKENSSVLTLGRGSGPRNLWEMSEGEKQKFTDWKGGSCPYLSPASRSSFFVPRRKILQLRRRRKSSKKLKHTHTHTHLHQPYSEEVWLAELGTEALGVISSVIRRMVRLGLLGPWWSWWQPWLDGEGRALPLKVAEKNPLIWHLCSQVGVLWYRGKEDKLLLQNFIASGWGELDIRVLEANSRTSPLIAKEAQVSMDVGWCFEV